MPHTASAVTEAEGLFLYTFGLEDEGVRGNGFIVRAAVARDARKSQSKTSLEERTRLKRGGTKVQRIVM